MVFTEFRFLWFFLIVLAVHWALRGQWRKLWLLAASYAFYAAWDWRFLSLIWLSTTVDYAVCLRIAATSVKRRRLAWLRLSLIVNLGLLGVFKYFNFFAENAVALGQWLGFTVHPFMVDIVLPVGISFYTFQTLSYSIDVYRGTLEPRRNFLDVALFVGFFPQLVAGPIVRASDFLPQLESPRRWADVAVRHYLLLFLVGFFKKGVVSDGIAPTVDEYFANPAGFDAFSAWLGTILYGIQIYCDFSGYSDIAIACAGLLGYRLALNFDFPYFSTNISEFWRRWHMSLSSWLRDYLYIPLGGNRGSRLFLYRNLMLTMLLGGLWHGAAWRFIVWGAMHGLALIVHRLWREEVAPRLPRGVKPVMPALGLALTFWWVSLAWIFFRAEDMESAWIVVRGFAFLTATGTATLAPPLAGLVALLALVHAASRQLQGRVSPNQIPAWLFAICYGAAFALVFSLMSPEVEPFIYFQF